MYPKHLLAKAIFLGHSVVVLRHHHDIFDKINHFYAKLHQVLLPGV